MAPRAKLNLKPIVSAEPEPTPEAAPRPPAAVPPSRRGKKMIGGHFPQGTWATFRHLATDEGKTTQELLEEALTDLFAKYRRP